MDEIEKSFEELWKEISTNIKGDLRAHNKETVSDFLEKLKQSINYKILSLSPKTPMSPEIRDKVEKAIISLKGLVDPVNCGVVTSISLETVLEEIKALESMLKSVNSLKVSSRPPQINEIDIIALFQLRKVFKNSFPNNKSEQYVKGNLLYQIGCSLLRRKTLPKAMDELIDTYMSNMIQSLEKNDEHAVADLIKNPDSLASIQVNVESITIPKKHLR